MSDSPVDIPSAAGDSRGPRSTSLLTLRVAAGVGGVVAVTVVVLAFLVSFWLGLAVAFVSPAIPMACVLAVERLRR